MVGLVCFDDPWGSVVEPLMPDRPKVRFKTKRAGGLRRAGVVVIRFRYAYAHQTCLCKQTRDGVTPEEDPTSLKKAKLESATREGHDIGPTVCEGRGNRSNEIAWTWHQGQLNSSL